ncbi:TrmH family RNA methyltransferase [Caldilinea sp.]|uniref:RNA methyltransferase n=1 Tax=Caldilinea sp. TaxID=2293560 RepID=UPI002B6A1613|nr:TrmH family RNA methyltransferase [Caldilinea sp.]HRA66205.1 TrmH family RNA methyltransferase [Caldilinea sp.]
MNKSDALEEVIVVLHRPEDPVNLAAVVRAMKNMGFSHLRLVQPVSYAVSELQRVAHHCEDLIERIEHFATLDAALADCHVVVGTAAIHHPGAPVSTDLRGLAGELAARGQRERVALLFGAEADGLDRVALDRCHLIAMIPANPDYPALNLAQAVLLLLYEVRMAVVGVASLVKTAQPEPPRATQAQLERLFQSSEAALASIGFFRYNPAAVMRTLRQLAYRAALQPEETALLLAMARRIERAAPAQDSNEDNG